MKISTKGRYGLRAMIDLALHSGEGKVSLNNIAERQNISLNYLEQAFSALKKSGLIKSIKGAQGGYVLAMPPEQISVHSILTVLEGDLSIVDKPNGDEEENLLQQCIRMCVWDKIDENINNIIKKQTLKDMVEAYNKAKQSHSPMFYI